MALLGTRYGFAEFEIDVARYELRRAGMPVRIEKLPLELLLFLIERRGELVTRAEIAERLWGKGVALETEPGINTAVRKVRAALGDDPDAPRFLKTVVGKGYRFEGEVTVGTGERGTSAPLIPTATPPSASAPATSPARTAGPSRRARAAVAAVLGLALLATAAAGVRRWQNRPRPGPPTIAVLPLENLSGDPAEDYFADGMTDALIAQLARLQGLRVISRTSSLQYRRARQPVREIARALGADAVVEGAVARSGGRVRITAELVDARTDRHVWAETYERALQDVLDVQAEVATNVARRVLVALSPDDARRLRASGGAVDPAAYDAYLRGRALWGHRSEAALTDAVKRFERAIELDPGFARAWSGLADAYAALGYTSVRSPEETFPRARSAALHAIELDPTLAEAHAVLAYCRLYGDWDWAAAEEGFRTAITLDPSSAAAHHGYSVLLTARGRDDEAAAEIERARALDPLSVAIQTDIGFELYYAGRYNDAVAQLRRVLRTSPAFPLAHLWLGRAEEERQRWDDAIDELARAERALPEWAVAIAALGHAQGAAGRTDEARAALRRLEALSSRRYVTPYGVALVHAALGEDDAAFRWLRRAYDERAHWLVWLSRDPRFSSLRRDPRFADLVARIQR
ncbi:MAG TPA: tetratricopeptide repeat protein [Anaeromyxobacter sp.]